MRILNLRGTNVWKKLQSDTDGTRSQACFVFLPNNCHKTVNKSDHIFFWLRKNQTVNSLHIHPLLHHVCWAVCLGVSEPPSTEAWTVWKRATSRGAALPSLGQLSIHDYCLHAYYCSQNKRSTCLSIQKYTLSRWSAMCLAQGHTASMTSQQGKCDVVSDALAMIVSLNGHFWRRWHSAWIIAM